jgi:hypothetical protein
VLGQDKMSHTDLYHTGTKAESTPPPSLVFTSAPQTRFTSPEPVSCEGHPSDTGGDVSDSESHANDDLTCHAVEREGAYHSEGPLLGISDTPNKSWEGDSEGSESSDESEGPESDQEEAGGKSDDAKDHKMDVVE